MPITIIQGEQRGDEGKGRFVDMLAEEHEIVARYNGGANAGHTVMLPDGDVFKLHLMPSGITHPHTVNVVGNGTYIDPVKFAGEIKGVKERGIDVTPANLKISSAAHLIFPHHKLADIIREKSAGRQGSTLTGIAQVAADKYLRTGMQIGEVEHRELDVLTMAYKGLKAQREVRQELEINMPANDVEIAKEFTARAMRLAEFITDTVLYLNQELRKDKPARVLAESAQAFLLDIDHGMYPYVTSSSPIAGGVSPGLGVPSTFVDRVIGVVKASQSHVGDGPFVTEINEPAELKKLHGDLGAIDAERGTTTDRVRRLGYLDLPQIRRAQMVNGTQETALAKLDWVPRYGEEVKICIGYNQNGKLLEIAPPSARELEQCEPELKTLPTWDEDIQETRQFSDLPKNAQKYVEFIEKQTGVPITMIGVGPRRDQVIIR